MPTDARTTSRVRAADELKHAALEQFATVGFAGTSLQHIADEAGYAKSSVLYHFASKEALLEAAIEPAVEGFEDVLEVFLSARRSGRRGELVDRVVDLLLEHREAVHVFLTQGQSLSELPVIARANVAVRRLASAVCEERESVDDQVRFGIALGGAAFLLTAGRSFADESTLPSDDEMRDALRRIIAEILTPARTPSN
ncbi:TetR/AcrR family transcriptional regulator [Agromyces binzhouensis]|uniref:TetR/AcrR family transcriptional regulator n=1 Tax=Agromyces binzhouensis TaxID=1817495 RepID=A0A4Q2JES3_9MICO|nr:TetR/AcrR family transcriptional regulator [Agromyces binzhouensis]RXZ46261.1 TetR/AcrR family transcriptional regulator [Agromyces binzhouensis]